MTNSKTSRREKINIMVTPEERKIIMEKVREYGYGDKLAEYVRDACIYERIYVEEITGKTEVCKIVSEFISVVKDILKIQTNISKNITITKSDIETIKKQNVEINNSIEELTRKIISKLSSSSVSKFQKRLRLVEKNKVTKDFINYVLNKKFVIVIPSTLSIKRENEGLLLISIDDKEVLNIETLEEENFINIINMQREKAIKDKCYLFFSSEDKKLNIYIADYFKESKKGIDNYKSKIKEGKKVKLYSCKTKEEL